MYDNQITDDWFKEKFLKAEGVGKHFIYIGTTVQIIADFFSGSIQANAMKQVFLCSERK